MSKRILLIENNKLDARKIGQHLREQGHEVVLATDGQEGFDLFVGHPPDLAVVDMLLPKVSGSELCLKLRETDEGKEVPLVLISSIFKNMQLDRIAKSRWQVDLFVEKPFDMERLGHQIDELMHVTDEDRGSQRPVDSIPDDQAELIAGEDASAGFDEAVTLESHPAQDSADSLPEIELPDDTQTAKENPAEKQFRERTVLRQEEFHLKEISDQGDLSENSVPEILVHLYYREASGMLVVQNNETKKKVYIMNGHPVYVESALREETLGRMLVREGLISEEDCYVSLKNMRTYHLQHGGSMVQAGILSPLQLMDALRRQMRMKVVNLFAWFEGEYKFERKRIKSSKAGAFQITAPSIVLEGVQEFYDPENIRTIFGEIQHLRLRLKDHLPFGLNELDFSDEELKLVNMADGSRSILQMLNESKVDQNKAVRNLYALMLLGSFEGIIEEKEIVEIENQDGPGFPDIELLEEQAELAARKLEDFSFGLDKDIEEAAVPHVDVDELSFEVDLSDMQAEEGVQSDAQPAAVRAEAVPETKPSSLEVEAQADAGAIAMEAPDPTEPQTAFVAPQEEDSIIDRLADDLVNPVNEASDVAADSPEVEVQEEISQEDRDQRDRILADYLNLDNGNHYDVMGLERSAKTEEIKGRYNEMAKVYHADTLGDKFNADVLEKANAVFSRVTEAYKVLINLDKRAQYDRRLSETGDEMKERRISNILLAENHFNRGAAQLRQKNYKGAAEAFAEAIELFPEESEYHSSLGWSIYHMPGMDENTRYQEAFERIQKAIQLNPKSDVAYYYLGMLLKDRKDMDHAMQSFAQAFKYNRKNLQAKEELKNLQFERVKQRKTPHKGKQKASIKGIFRSDVDLDTVKKSILKIFWS